MFIPLIRIAWRPLAERIGNIHNTGKPVGEAVWTEGEPAERTVDVVDLAVLQCAGNLECDGIPVAGNLLVVIGACRTRLKTAKQIRRTGLGGIQKVGDHQCHRAPDIGCTASGKGIGDSQNRIRTGTHAALQRPFGIAASVVTANGIDVEPVHLLEIQQVFVDTVRLVRRVVEKPELRKPDVAFLVVLQPINDGRVVRVILGDALVAKIRNLGGIL